MKENSLVKHERPFVFRYHPSFLSWFLFLVWQTLNPIQNEIVLIPCTYSSSVALVVPLHLACAGKCLTASSPKR